jgi:hypothetical protein
LTKRLSCILEEKRARVRHSHACAVAFKNRYAKLVLKISDAAAHHRLLYA